MPIVTKINNDSLVELQEFLKGHYVMGQDYIKGVHINLHDINKNKNVALEIRNISHTQTAKLNQYFSKLSGKTGVKISSVGWKGEPYGYNFSSDISDSDGAKLQVPAFMIKEIVYA